MKKKEYIRPQIVAVRIQPAALMTASGETKENFDIGFEENNEEYNGEFN